MRHRPLPTLAPVRLSLWRAVSLAALLLATPSCGGGEPGGQDRTTPHDPDDPDDPDGGPCPTPRRLVGDTCVDPGVQDDGCPAGTLGVDGDCLPAGVTPDGCAAGFVHDGDRGCEPVLPAAPCPEGELALPGETSCQPLMECGTGTWGDIPVEGDTVYVDGSATGKGEGTVDKPFTSVTDAVAAAPEGAIIAIAAGTYVDLYLIDRPVRLWGRCPSLVRLAGIFPDMAQMVIQADGVEVHGISMTAPGGGIAMSDQSDVLLDRVWLHGLTDRGFSVAEHDAPTSLTLTRCLVEGAVELAIGAFGGTTTIVDTVVRSTEPDGDGNEGRGINVQRSSTGAAATLDLERVVIRQSGNHGLFASDADLFAHRTVVLDTLGQPSDGDAGTGILVQSTEDDSTPTARITSSFVARSHYVGVLSIRANIELEGLTVDDTLPRQSDQAGGVPLGLLTSDANLTAVVRSTLLQGGASIGLSGRGRGITAEGVAIRGIGPGATAGAGVAAVAIRTHDDDTPGELSARGIHIESAGDYGLYAGGAAATIDGLYVEVVAPEGGGVFADYEGPAYLPSDVTLRGSVVTGAQGFGVSAFASHLTLEGTVVRDTLATTEGIFGDGVGVTSIEAAGAVPATALLRSSRVSDNARAGVASFGGGVELEHSATACNVLDLTGQTYNGAGAQFNDLGHNLCGCPEGTSDCQVLSAEVTPPLAPSPPVQQDAPSGTKADEPPNL